MSSDIVKRLHDSWSNGLRRECIAHIEALEGEAKTLAASLRAAQLETMRNFARAERLRVAALEALNNLIDRVDNDCACSDCVHTLPCAISTLTEALEDDKQ